MAAKLKAADIIENRPNRLEYTGLEKMLMAVSIALLAVTMVRLGLNYGSLPAEIPTHFDFEGKVDGSDGKGSLLILAGVDVACTLLMLVCGHFPRGINVPVSMLKRPAEDIVHGTRVYLYLTTILMVALFWYLIEGTMLVAKGVWMGLPSFGIWAFMLVLFVSSAFISIGCGVAKTGKGGHDDDAKIPRKHASKLFCGFRRSSTTP